MWPEQHLSRSIVYAYTAFTVYSTEGVLGCGGCGSTAAKWRRVLLRIERRYRDQCRGASGSRYAGRVRRAGGGWRRVCAADAVPRRVSGVQFMWTNAKRNMRCNVLFPRPRATSTSRGRLTVKTVGLRLDPRGPAGTSGTTRASGARGRRRGFFTAALVNNPLVSRLTPYRIFREMSKEEMPQSEHDEIQQHAPAWACMVLSSPWCERSQSYSLRFNNMSAQVCARMHFVMEDADETNALRTVPYLVGNDRVSRSLLAAFFL